ncbi:MAG: transglycosylase domain-containing protein [Nocardioidaceae bacterium]
MRRALLVVCGLILLAIAAGAVVYAVTPSVADAQARVRARARHDGASHLGAPVPRRFAESIVASEDSRFYSEPGIDPIGIARAGWMTLTRSGTDPGGSTLSQQLAKQLYTNGRTGVLLDTEQVALAVKLNLHYSKPQILRMYAGTVYFGHGFYGLYNASCGFFAVPPPQMTLAQASMLAGLVQAPSAYDPLKHLGLARARQQYVLGRLRATGKISPARTRAAQRAPLHLDNSDTAGACGA